MGQYRLREDTTAENPLNALKIANSLKQSMWAKAQDLTRDDNSIVKAPGSDTAYMVRSYSNERPYYVQVLKSGNIVLMLFTILHFPHSPFVATWSIFLCFMLP